MKVSLVGCGCGAETLTAEADEAIARAELVIGSERMIREHGKGKPCVPATRPEEIVSALRQSECESAAVLLGGDSGFYSGAKSLLPLLSEERVTVARARLAELESLFFPRPGVQSGVGGMQREAGLLSYGIGCRTVRAVCSFLRSGAQRPLGDYRRESGHRRGANTQWNSKRLCKLQVLFAECAAGRKSPAFS